MMSRVFGLCAIFMCGATVLGCADGDVNDAVGGTTAPTSSVAPSMVVTVPPPPVQTGPKQVRLDPCTRLGDDIVTRIGFDPATRARSGGIVTESLTTIGCDFLRNEDVRGEKVPVGLLTVRSSTRTIDEVRADKSFPVVANEVIGGLGAAVYQLPQAPQTCAIAIKSKDGTLDINLLNSSNNASNVCDEVTTIARSIVVILDGT
ncbi:DUF3558 domain-containing protein [Nocardia farcinica]|uniref:DUF3558 family protein n=1 Tax=Nocardia farcinica TaxID=37329 RepID=UPI001B3C4E1B|nr:DUF3558 family protein [Nocardia farcinica]MBF6537445.1 DUF3558 domain-containing protein [Nocardia farcinica]